MSETAGARAGGSGGRRSLGPETWIWCCATLAVAIAFGWLGSLGWPGEPSGCLTRFVCFCEAVQPGVARQPWNTWSNLPAIALAGWVSWQVSAIRRDAARQADDRLTRVAGVGGVFAAMLWFQGVGSLFFHGALTRWSAVLDALSVFFVAGVLLVTNLLRLGWLGWGGYWKALLSVLGLGLIYRLYVIPMTAPAVLVFGIGVAATEVACARKRRREGAVRARVDGFGTGSGSSCSACWPLRCRSRPACLFARRRWESRATRSGMSPARWRATSSGSMPGCSSPCLRQPRCRQALLAPFPATCDIQSP
jgi:hypothetical protein